MTFDMVGLFVFACLGSFAAGVLVGFRTYPWAVFCPKCREPKYDLESR